MRILILGNNYCAESFFNNLKNRENDIVFTNCSKVKSSVKYTDERDLIDFCEANEINFVLITDKTYMVESFLEKLNSLNITVFAPTSEAIKICKYKSYVKKFINKNKFLSPKYFIAEKLNMATDYLKSTNLPVAIHPEETTESECVQFAETYRDAQKIINKFFESGNKKIVLEDYIQGKNFTIWTISDGYSAKIMGINAKYQNKIGMSDPHFVTNELKQNLLENVINPAIASLAEEEEYIGILGFNFILDNKNNPYLLGFNCFFDEISVDFYTNCCEIDWIDVFESCIIGNIFSKYNFKANDEYALTIKTDNEIKFISSKIKSNLDKYVSELGYDTQDYKEAIQLWKY